MTAETARGTWLAGETLEWYVLHRRGSALVGLGGSPFDTANQGPNDAHEPYGDSA
jgi:hypothetical protein